MDWEKQVREKGLEEGSGPGSLQLHNTKVTRQESTFTPAFWVENKLCIPSLEGNDPVRLTFGFR